MITDDFFVDIHTHATLRAFNATFSSGQRNIWEKTTNQAFETPIGRWARMKSREVSKTSQANLYNYAEGNTRIIFDSLYPFEKGFLNFRKLPTAMVGKDNADILLKTVTGIDDSQLQALRGNHDYFQELLGQYAFLYKGQGQSPNGAYNYQLASNYQEAMKIVQGDPKALAVIVTIEGGHALNCGLPGGKKRVAALESELLENIGTLKSWKASPFFMTFAHHFYNELSGHTRSMKPMVSRIYNQKEGLDEGISKLGWSVLHELLAQDNGRRILIDVKHMSVKARREYYQMLDSHNRLTRTERIPIVCSHTGVNGFKTMKGSKRKKDKLRKMKKSEFHNWAINISDEEIRIIAGTRGLIGLMVDKGILASKVRLEKISEFEDPELIKEAMLELIAQNIFQIVSAVGGKQGWDTIALGTDFDGSITHLDPYFEASRLPHLREDLVAFLKRRRYAEHLWFGYEPEEMVRKVMQTNALNFLERHYV